MDEIFSVDELAKAADTTARTVRLYVEKGLLDPLRAGRTLCFTPKDLERLHDILRAKRLGFTLKEIHQGYTNPTPRALGDRAQRIRQIKTDADQELAALDRQMKARR